MPSSIIARVAALTKPRYHISSAAKYSALAPFVVSTAVHSTRYIELAPARRGKGEQWIYAADVVPLRHMTPSEHAHTRTFPAIPAPYHDGSGGNSKGPARQGIRTGQINNKISSSSGPTKRPANAMQSGNGSQIPSAPLQKRPRGNLPSKISNSSNRGCWFCLANEKDLHLVTWIGEDFYVAAAKGGIMPEHFLIVPIAHVYCSLDLSITSAMHTEIATIKRAIAKYYDVKLEGSKPYFFERAVRTRGGEELMHMHIQCVPIKLAATAGALDVALSIADRFGMDLRHIPENNCIASLRREFEKNGVSYNAKETLCQYFWAELPDGNRVIQIIPDEMESSERRDKTTLSEPRGENENLSKPEDMTKLAIWQNRTQDAASSCDAKEGKQRGYPLQFGRQVATTLLAVQHRIDWKQCVGDIREEKRAALALRDSFHDFAPT